MTAQNSLCLVPSEFLLKTYKSLIFAFSDPLSNKKYVAKMISNDKFSSNEEEFNIIAQFNHPHIIKALEYRKERTQDFMITEFMDNGDLLSFLLKNKSKLAKKKFVRDQPVFEKFWRTLLVQIVDALIYMKSFGWAHLDIKPENILLNSSFEAKLIDFEYACLCKDEASRSDKICGTMSYFSPEIKERKLPYDPFQSDVFSLGVTFCNLMGLCDIFAREENYSHMKTGKFDKIWKKMNVISLTKCFSCGFREMIEMMLEYDPGKRISIEELRENEWFCQDLFTKEQMQSLFESL